MRKIAYTLITFLFAFAVSAQRMSVQQYIETYREYAISEMIRTGVPASITLAQGILEADYGNSRLAKEGNNHFGIKCKESWSGETIHHDDNRNAECFRKYQSAEESYKDHSDFLRTRRHYAFLFDLDPMDYRAWAYGLKKAGYATNPSYPELLIRNIEQYQLDQYSTIAMERCEEMASPNSNLRTTANSGRKQHQKGGIMAGTSAADQQKGNKDVRYPEGIFKINKRKVVFARKGTSLLFLANKHAISYRQLLTFNHLQEKELLERDQLIFIQQKRKSSPNKQHVVAVGETLYDIAQKQGVRLDYLYKYNRFNERHQLLTGEIIFLQKKSLVAAIFTAKETVEVPVKIAK